MQVCLEICVKNNAYIDLYFVQIKALFTVFWQPIFHQFSRQIAVFSDTINDKNIANFWILWVNYVRNYNFWKYWFWGHMTPQGHMTSKCKLAIISETVEIEWNRANFRTQWVYYQQNYNFWKD